MYQEMQKKLRCGRTGSAFGGSLEPGVSFVGI
jgi:hypothetical protein